MNTKAIKQTTPKPPLLKLCENTVAVRLQMNRQ